MRPYLKDAAYISAVCDRRATNVVYPPKMHPRTLGVVTARLGDSVWVQSKNNRSGRDKPRTGEDAARTLAGVERNGVCLEFRRAHPGAISGHRGWTGTLIGAQLVRPVSTQSWSLRNCAIVLASQMPQ
jgi:hypothetical protein